MFFSSSCFQKAYILRERGGGGGRQSVANNLSDEWIWIWILLQKTYSTIQTWILFLTYCVTNMNKNTVHKKYSQIYFNIQIYSMFENNQTSGYCYLQVWQMWLRYLKYFVTLHISNEVKYLKQNSSFFVYYNW